ncbi:hypothetical protein [Nocardia brasiliensis]|uniref:hypothetical protein n=1 Tax=Nocardia brasiliensis TaxID=37326 RepID=UPI003D9262D3
MTGYADANCEDMYRDQLYARSIIEILAGTEQQLIDDADAHNITVRDRGVEFKLRNSPTGVENVIITVNTNDFIDLHFSGDTFGQEEIHNAHIATLRTHFAEFTGRITGPRRILARSRPATAAIFEMRNARTAARLSVYAPTYYLSHDPLFRLVHLDDPRALPTIAEYTLADTLAHIHTAKDQWHTNGGVECRTATGSFQHHFQPFDGHPRNPDNDNPGWTQADPPAHEPPTLGEVSRALDRIAAAVTDNDLDEYLRAVVHGVHLELTPEQIRDCYTYRAHRDGYPSFDKLGNPR